VRVDGGLSVFSVIALRLDCTPAEATLNENVSMRQGQAIPGYTIPRRLLVLGDSIVEGSRNLGAPTRSRSLAGGHGL
jgi:hypothetical protein